MAEAAERGTTPREVMLGATRAYLHHCVEKVAWFRLTHSRDFQDQYGSLAAAGDLGAMGARAEQTVKRHMATAMPAELVDDHYRGFWTLAIGLATLVAERNFRRVETDEERLAVAERVLALQLDTVLAAHTGSGGG